MPSRRKKLLDQVRDLRQLHRYSIRTETAYLSWIKRYMLFQHKRHPNAMRYTEIEAFLTHVAVEQRVATSMQNQALSALPKPSPSI
jgi:hypothetical protein